MNQGTSLQREMAICASGVGRYHAKIQRGPVVSWCSLEAYESTLSDRLGDKYRYDPDWLIGAKDGGTSSRDRIWCDVNFAGRMRSTKMLRGFGHSQSNGGAECKRLYE